MKNKNAKTTLYSLITVVTLVTIIISGWFALTSMLELGRKMMKSSSLFKGNKQTTSIDVPEKNTIKFIKGKAPLNAKKDKIQKAALDKYFILKQLEQGSFDTKKIKGNEEYAISMLQKYLKAQNNFIKATGKYANDCSSLKFVKENSAAEIEADLKIVDLAYTVQKASNGYYYLETVRDNVGRNSLRANDYVISAVPAAYGVSGINTYCIDSKKGSIILKKNNGARPVFYSEEVTSTWKKIQ